MVEVCWPLLQRYRGNTITRHHSKFEFYLDRTHLIWLQKNKTKTAWLVRFSLFHFSFSYNHVTEEKNGLEFHNVYHILHVFTYLWFYQIKLFIGWVHNSTKGAKNLFMWRMGRKRHEVMLDYNWIICCNLLLGTILFGICQGSTNFIWVCSQTWVRDYHWFGPARARA